MPRKKRDGSPMFAPQRPALVIDRVRYVGDPVAMVVAETLDAGQGRGGAGRGRVRGAAAVTAHRGHGEARRAARLGREPGQHLPHRRARQQGGHRCRLRARPPMWCGGATSITRVHAQYMEPRGSIGSYDPGEERYTLYADVNYPHRVRNMLAQTRCSRCRRARCGWSPGRRRRLRHQGLAVCRAPPDAVGGAQARPAGQVDAASAPRRCSPTSMAATMSARSSLRSTPTGGSSACGCTCWPISAPISAPTASLLDAVRPDRHGDRRLRRSRRPM